jgi:glycosyltransferase involved in cell wall biosynthesis
MLGIPLHGPVVGCVAHLSPKKGQEHLLRAVALLKDDWPDLQCLLVGEGSMARELERLAGELGIADRVRLLGYRADVVAVMNAMDIVVLPSVAKEGLGLVLVEAALLGKATVGSDAPGIDEAVQDGVSGFLVPPGNPASLAGRIAELLENPALRDRMGMAGQKRALELFSLEAMADKLETVYYELVRTGHQGRRP